MYRLRELPGSVVIASVITVMSPACVDKTETPPAAPKTEAKGQPATKTDEGSRTMDYIVVSNEDSGQLSVIDGTSDSLVSTFNVGRRPRGIKASPDGQCIFVALSGSPKCPPTIPEQECAKKHKDSSQDGIAQVDWRSERVSRVYPSGSDPEQFDIIGPAAGCKGTRLFIANEDVGKLSVVDTDEGKVLAEVETGDEPEGVRVNPDGSVVVVASEEDSLLTIVDTKTYKVLANIKVATRPRDLVFSPSGDRLYVSAELGAQIDIVDMNKRARIGSIKLPQGSLPMGLALSADGGTLYVATGRGGKLLAIDLGKKAVTRSVEVGPRPWGIALSSDGRRIYTANGPSDDVSVVDTETFKVVKKVKVGESPWTAITVPSTSLKP